MTVGTEIIQDALESIGAHSVISPASPDSISTGMKWLNGMIAGWQDNGINMGCVPLKTPGSELSEPLGAKNAIISNLAVLLHPKFPGSQVSPQLKVDASKGYNSIVKHYKTITIPKKVVRPTLPKGQGNRGYWVGEFFKEDSEIG